MTQKQVWANPPILNIAHKHTTEILRFYWTLPKATNPFPLILWGTYWKNLKQNNKSFKQPKELKHDMRKVPLFYNSYEIKHLPAPSKEFFLVG